MVGSAPGGIRTHDPRLRRPILYPAELQAHCTGWRYYSPPVSGVQRLLIVPPIIELRGRVASASASGAPDYSISERSGTSERGA